MRKFHRWTSIIAVAFLVIVAATGVILQVQKLLGGNEDDPDNFRASTSLTTATPHAVYADMLDRALSAAQARAPGAPILSVMLRMGDKPKVLVTLPGEPGRQIVVDARTGVILKDENYEPEPLMQRIHDGSILGEPGVVMGVLWGSALVALTVTGFWVYFDMYRRRMKARGKSQFFW